MNNQQALESANEERARKAAERRSAQADWAIRILDTRPPLQVPTVHAAHRATLHLRASNPEATMRELATKVGVGKHTFASKLWRALRYATRMQAHAA